MKGTLIYTVTYSIPKEALQQSLSSKDEVVKPAKSAPNYEEYFPRFSIIKPPFVQEVHGKKVIFEMKSFGTSSLITNLIIESSLPFSFTRPESILKLTDMLFEESKLLAQPYSPSHSYEEYVFFLVTEYGKNMELFVKKNAHLISAALKDEPLELVDKEVALTIENNIRYGKRDITIVDWDGAFLVDGKAEFREAIAVLELANIQLLNLRILDTKLQDKIALLKKQIEPGNLGSFFKLSPYMKDIIKIRSQSVIELENIDNSLKLYGDWYSARLYDLAGRKFYLEKWKSAVEKKLNVLKDLYEMVSHVMTERYNLILEFTIVVLIVFEIAMAFLV